jgi:hypothetical protein
MTQYSKLFRLALLAVLALGLIGSALRAFLPV